jgi:hypothetical protein
MGLDAMIENGDIKIEDLTDEKIDEIFANAPKVHSTIYLEPLPRTMKMLTKPQVMQVVNHLRKKHSQTTPKTTSPNASVPSPPEPPQNEKR